MPASINSADYTTIEGIALSATGMYLNSVEADMLQTYGKALTEKVTGGDHTITISKGDWKVICENGSVTLQNKHEIELISNNAHMWFKAPKGTSRTSDARDVRSSTQNQTTAIAGYEYSGISGMATKDNRGFSLSINVAGEFIAKSGEFKTTGLSLKMTAFSFGFGLGSIKFQLIAKKYAIIDGKKVIVYNKITPWQIYNELLKKENSLVKKEFEKTIDKSTYAATLERQAANISFYNFLKM